MVDLLFAAKTIALVTLASAFAVAVPRDAEAFVIKQTSNGHPVRWGTAAIAFTIDETLDDAVDGGAAIAASAFDAWNVVGAPRLETLMGAARAGAGRPGYDGTNGVYYMKNGFAPAGRALAVTVTSFDEVTGRILDCDIVVNGRYAFAAIPDDARPDADEQPRSTEGGSDDGRQVFDLSHVIAHEVGHSLGLGDEPKDTSALMYGYTSPGDPSRRAVSADDFAGIGALYGAAETPQAASSSGCATSPARACLPAALVLALLAWSLCRRRRLAVATFAALALVTLVTPARSAPRGRGHARAHVVAKRVHDSGGGILKTTLHVRTAHCHVTSCPESAEVELWGGSKDGIVQQIGETPVPREGDLVDVVFDANVAGAASVLLSDVTIRP